MRRISAAAAALLVDIAPELQKQSLRDAQLRKQQRFAAAVLTEQTQYATRPHPERIRRMASIDALPAEVRALVHEYGLRMVRSPGLELTAANAQRIELACIMARAEWQESQEAIIYV